MAEDNRRNLSAGWALLSVTVGFAFAILMGQFWSDGGAEIAGIMLASLIVCTRAFWDLRVMGWFMPVVIGWTGLNAIVLGMILPLELAASKGFIMLVMAEFFAFFGVIFLASRLWGEPPDDTSAHS